MSLRPLCASINLPHEGVNESGGQRIMSGSYRDLRVWQNAMDLVVGVYHETQKFPREELYGPTTQMRRAAVSIPSNIAEGKGRSTDRDRALFFCQARGSLLELETQILIGQRLAYLLPPRAEATLKTRAGRISCLPR